VPCCARIKDAFERSVREEREREREEKEERERERRE
jgi:hypothetical protein